MAKVRQRTWTVPGQRTRRKAWGFVIRLADTDTKSGRRREVPMRQAVYEALAKLPGEHTGRVWPAGDIRTAFENAVAEAKLDSLHFHDLRHSFAS